MDPLADIPIPEIDPRALPRDRVALDPADLHALQTSLALEGLRMPVEVWQLSAPRPRDDGPPHRYGLISGLRRLTAARGLGMPVIPAFIRSPASVPAAMAAMVTENEIRTQITPWEKGALIIAAVEEGHFDTPDAAVATLYHTLPRQAKARLRSFAMVVEALEGTFTTPERLSIERMERIATVLRLGGEDLLRSALMDTKGDGLTTQWQAIAPLLTDLIVSPQDFTTSDSPTRHRPRRMLHLKQGLTIRREICRGGYLLRFSGPEARKGGLIDDVLDMVEERFAKP